MTLPAALRHTVLTLLLAVATLAHALPMDGVALGSSLRRDDAGAPLFTESDRLEQVGEDGPAAWFWPQLPGNEIVYRTALFMPGDALLHGLRVAHAGTTTSLADTLRLTLRNAALQVLLDSTVLLTGGGGEAGDLRFTSPIGLAGGAWLYVDFTSHHPARAPWITADDDCRQGNVSWIRVGDASAAFQPLDRDLSVRALVEWEAGGDPGPRLRLPANLAWSATLPVVDLRLRARDSDGIDTVWAGASNVPNWAVGLTRLGPSSQDAAWEEWGLVLQPAAVVPVGEDHLSLEFSAVDSLGNESAVLSAWVQMEEDAHWSPASRDDQAWQPGNPLVPGTALAQRVPLSRIVDDNGLISAVVRGARMRARGEGHFLLRLVQDVNGLPGHSDAGWVELADSVLVASGGSCGEVLDASFTNPVQGLEQGEQVWILLDYSLPEHAFSAPAPLLEWYDPQGRPADSLCSSWSWNPLEEEWLPLPTGSLLLDARLEAESCDFTLPFLADFDATFADLQCWQEEHALGSTGWLPATAASANSSCFLPGGEAFNSTQLMSGTFMMVNSDAQGQGVQQADTLSTPWLRSTDGAHISFSSCMGFSSPDEASLVWRSRESGVAGPWQVALGMTDMLALSDSLVCGIAHPNWSRVEHELAVVGSTLEFQVAFALQSTWGTGWAVDSLLITAATAQAPSPWDGPQHAVVELGRIHPNPFNPECVLPWRLKRGGPARLEVFNLLGQRVALLVDEPVQAAGDYRAVFHPNDLASGVYIARLESSGAVDCRRLVYVK